MFERIELAGRSAPGVIYYGPPITVTHDASARSSETGGRFMSTREEFWRYVCSNAHYLYIMLVFVLVMAVMNALAMAIAEQSEGPFIVSLMVFAILGVTGTGIGAVLWRCNQR